MANKIEVQSVSQKIEERVLTREIRDAQIKAALAKVELLKKSKKKKG